jgi:Bacterial Ig-like domain
VPTIPTLLRRPLAGLAAALVLSPLVAGLQAAPVYATGSGSFVSLANVKRAGVGLGPVSMLASVDQIAVERGGQMAAADVLAHDLTYVTTRLGQLGVCWTGVGEIIAWQSAGMAQSYQFTIDQWWASPGHHAIIVGDYNVAAGSWSVSASGGTYSVMVFVKTCSPLVATNVAPAVVARSPGSGATGVTLTPSVSVSFSEAVQGVSTSTFVLRDASSGAVVGSTVSYDATAHRAVLRPGSRLALGRTYRVTLSSSIRDAAGSSLAATSWTFRATTSQAYNPARLLHIAAGVHVGYRFSSTGAILARRSYTLARGSSAPTSRYALIANRTGSWFYVTAGVWAGYWLPASSSVTLP